MDNIYESIEKRTGGDIYIGVVGPVRSGKSTFIKKFMETLVIPNIKNDYDRKRAKDEMLNYQPDMQMDITDFPEVLP